MMTMDERTPAQVFAIVIGAALVAAGITGFFYSASFDTGDGLPSATPSSGSST